MRQSWFSYLITDAPGMGCDEQNGVPVSMGKMHRQPLLQGLLTPQLPPHVAVPFALLCNCRAETVPAHKTPMTSAAKKVDLIFFFMIPSSCVFKGWNFFRKPASRLRHYFPGATTPAGRVVQNAVNGVVNEQKQPLAQACVALHVPPHVVAAGAPFRNCRAETVPAQRTAVSMAANNVVLMVFIINCAPLTLRTSHGW